MVLLQLLFVSGIVVLEVLGGLVSLPASLGSEGQSATLTCYNKDHNKWVCGKYSNGYDQTNCTVTWWRNGELLDNSTGKYIIAEQDVTAYSSSSEANRNGISQMCGYADVPFREALIVDDWRWQDQEYRSYSSGFCIHSTLQITSLTTSDFGDYECRVEKVDVGSKSAKVTLYNNASGYTGDNAVVYENIGIRRDFRVTDAIANCKYIGEKQDIRVFIELENGSTLHWPDFYRSGDYYSCNTEANLTTISDGIVHNSYFYIVGMCHIDAPIQVSCSGSSVESVAAIADFTDMSYGTKEARQGILWGVGVCLSVIIILLIMGAGLFAGVRAKMCSCCDY